MLPDGSRLETIQSNFFSDEENEEVQPFDTQWVGT
jgi:hypothetical protein